MTSGRVHLGMIVYTLIIARSFPGPSVWLGLAYLSVLSTAGTFWILQFSAARLGPNRVVAYTFLTPSAVAAMEWAMGRSGVAWSVLPGIGLTLIAVVLLQMPAVSGTGGPR